MSRLASAVLFLAICVPPVLAQDKATPGLSITPEKVTFPQQAVETTSQPLAITITNASSSPVTFEEIVPSGIDFLAQNNCQEQLAAAAECTIQVQFKPAESGDRTGILEIVATDSANPHLVPLTGVGAESVSPEGASTAGSLPSLNGNENLSPEEKRQPPVEVRRAGPAQRRKRGRSASK